MSKTVPLQDNKLMVAYVTVNMLSSSCLWTFLFSLFKEKATA